MYPSTISSSYIAIGMMKVYDCLRCRLRDVPMLSKVHITDTTGVDTSTLQNESVDVGHYEESSSLLQLHPDHTIHIHSVTYSSSSSNSNIRLYNDDDESDIPTSTTTVHLIRQQGFYVRGLHYDNVVGLRDSGSSSRYSSSSSRITSYNISTNGNSNGTTNNGHNGIPFNVASILSVVLCGVIITLFVWLGYCLYWFMNGSGSNDDDDENEKPNNELNMTKEERIVYLKDVLKSKTFVFTINSQYEMKTYVDTSVEYRCDDPIERKHIVNATIQNDHNSNCNIKNTNGNIQYVTPQCSICLEHFMDGDIICEASSMNVQCKHEFHYSCIFEWCMVQTNCPCCRRDILFIDRTDDNNTEPNHSFRSDDSS